MNKTTLQPGDSADAVRRILRESAERIQEAAEMLARLVAEDESIIDRITSGPEAISDGVVNGLLRIASRSLHPKLLLNRCPSYTRISNLSYPIQKNILEKGSVEVVTDADTGDFIKVDVVKLEGRMLKQVLSRAGVRSRDEQRAWIRAKQSPKPPKITGAPYHIKRDKIILMRDHEFTRVELLRLLEQMVS